MRVKEFFFLYVTRNGQHMWTGPFATRQQAEAERQQNLHANAGIVAEQTVDHD